MICGKENDFVESVIPLKAVKSAVELQHWHDNKSLLDSLTSTGNAALYLGADGQYHEIPALFSVDAFLQQFDNLNGNVKASKSAANQLVLNTEYAFADETGGSVVGNIELLDVGNSELDLKITRVSLTDGAATVLPFAGFTGTGSVNLTAKTVSGKQFVNISLNTEAEPLSNFVTKVVPETRLDIAVLDTDGQIVDSKTTVSSLATASALSAHASNTTLHTTANEKAAWNAKQNALNTAQTLAVNSGITATKVAQYDAYANTKLSVSGLEANKNMVTDSSGNVSLADMPDLSVKVDKVQYATAGDVANLNADGSIVDSGVKLGVFSPNQTVREYIDTTVNSSISGSSYQGVYTYFGTKIEIEAVSGAKDGDTALAYEGTLDVVTGMATGVYNGTAWAWTNIAIVPSNGAWWEIDYALTSSPSLPARIILRQEGTSSPSLAVRTSSVTPVDNVTVGLDTDGYISFKQKTLPSGKTVLNATNADNIVFQVTSSGDVDTSKTIKQVVDEVKAGAEPAFTKNTAFNKNFDTSNQSAASTMVIGNNDTRLTNARPASDVPDWAKEETLQPSDVPNISAAKITSGTLSVDRIADGSITEDKLSVSFATAAQGTLAENAVRSVAASTTTTAGSVALSVNTGGTAATVVAPVAGLGALAYADKVGTERIEGLGSAATYSATNAVTAGSTALVTSGGVSSALTNLSAGSITSGLLPLERGGTGAAIATNLGGAIYHSVNGDTLVQGTLPVGMGGTGAATLAAGQVLVGAGTDAVTTKAIDTTVTAGSANLVTSGAVSTAVSNVKVTAGNVASKIFLTGVASQTAASALQTNTGVYATGSGELYGTKVFNAVYNDYAEYRLCSEVVDAGCIVVENVEKCDYVTLCKTKKPTSKMFVVSDTFGHCMGEHGEGVVSVPVAVAGRVLLQVEDACDLSVGDYVGCSKNGKGRRMSKFEAWLHPSRVLGTVSSIPLYKTWGSSEIQVNGRVWVNLK